MAAPENPLEGHRIRANVRSYYGKLAESAAVSSCCGEPSGAGERIDSTLLLYDATDVAGLPQEVIALSAGCGDPVTLASLEPGQTVLDLGSGGGIDCFFAAQKVGRDGHVIGVDMTPAMLEKARANLARLAFDNVEFRLGEIEHLPVPDASIDVVLSNCVINLSPDKEQVFREAFRALKPGGKLAVSDIVSDGPLPTELQKDPQSWCACVSGAISARAYSEGLAAAGFEDITIERIEYGTEQIDLLLDSAGVERPEGESGSHEGRMAYALVDGELKKTDGTQSALPYSARISARKPA
jgi:arsenite methyltransferase